MPQERGQSDPYLPSSINAGDTTTMLTMTDDNTDNGGQSNPQVPPA